MTENSVDRTGFSAGASVNSAPSPPRGEMSRAVVGSVVALLLLHAGWLAWSATWQSPTLNEPGQLAAGLAHWSFLRFEPAAVNPPPVRMLAAIPAVMMGCRTDWTGLRLAPGERCEAQLGMDLVAANGARVQQLMVWGRWMLIPVSIAGGLLSWIWGRALCGNAAGLVALALWCCEPMIIGHAQLVTNDIPATAAGLAVAMALWCWLTRCTARQSVVTGLALGAALLSKFSWVILVPVFPVLWLVVHGCRWQSGRLWRELLMMGLVCGTATVVVNSAYAWRGVGTRWGDIPFVSEGLRDPERPGSPGNRWQGTWVGGIPVPVAPDYLKGIDLQRRDFEGVPPESYFQGTWRRGGWWSYYFVGLLLKSSLGLLVLVAAGGIALVRGPVDRVGLACLAVPPAALFVLVSAETHFNHHVRYVLPCVGPLIVLAGCAVHCAGRRGRAAAWACVLATFVSSVRVAPASLAYFHELAGGIAGGPRHLLHSNVDWGQDLVALREWLRSRPDRDPVYLAYYGYFDPIDYGLDVAIAPFGPVKRHAPSASDWKPGWYAISVNYLHGCDWGMTDRHAYTRFQQIPPTATCGGSIFIFRVDAPGTREIGRG